MKKILAIIMAICMIATVLCVPAFAALLTELDAAPVGTVLRVSALMRGETNPVLVGEYTSFKDGWNDAMEIAGDEDDMKAKGYDRIVVDIYTDWEANKDGQFSDDWVGGAGFDNDTIYVPADARVTLNLNGHTIDRGLTDDQDDGEVIFINDDADVIINDGTIKGGFSNSEGGGLYIEGGANVTLNNVNIEENSVRGDDGAGIYLYGGATLTMNGGSVSRNFMDIKYFPFFDSIDPYGVVYAKDSTVVFNGVTFDGNYADTYADGLVIYAVGSTVKMNQCTVSNNATKGYASEEIIYAKDSSLTITDTDFINNNKCKVPDNVYEVGHRLLHLSDSDLSMAGGTISQNSGEELFYFYDSMADIKGVTITDNTAVVMYINNGNEVVNMTECTLGNNTPKGTLKAIRIANEGTLTMVDCILGDTTFNNPEYIKITTSEVSREEAVIGIDLLRADGTRITQKYYKDFAGGWNYVLECVETLAYDRIVVDLYADWETKWYGVITVPEKTRLTLNMNGHTIDRKQNNCIYDGEVIYISDNADVIINEGSIKNGYSMNGAGGIHIKYNATVVLNDVNIVENIADGSDGAGIAVYDGSVLVMNGGSISDNAMLSTKTYHYPYGLLYVNNATATLNNVTISNNRSESVNGEGVAIYADDSTVTLNDCVVSGNGTKEIGKYSESIIGGDSSTININNTDFIGNGAISDTDDTDYSHLFYLEDTTLTMTGGKITGNAADKLFYFDDSKADINGVNITGNDSVVLDVDNDSKKVTLTECVLGNNSPIKYDEDIIVDEEGTLVLNNCQLGDTTFEDKTMVAGVGSVFGEGSLSMIVAIIALVASAVSIFLIVDMKKKLVPATVKVAVESDDEE